MKKLLLTVIAVIVTIAFSNKPVSAPELTETAETTYVKSNPLTAKIKSVTQKTVATTEKTTQTTTVAVVTQPRVVKPPKIDDPNGLIQSVKQIDLTLPKNQSYKDYIPACHCSTCSNESTVIETEKEWLYPLGDSYIATNKGREYNLYYIDGATREKGQILAGWSDTPDWEQEQKFAYDFLKTNGTKLLNLAGPAYHYYFVEAIDDSRFIYGIGGWEWSIGYGLFDVARNENLPFRFGDTEWRDEAYERNDCPTHDYLGRVDDKIYCIEANQDWYAGAVDNLDVTEIDLDDYSTKIYPVKLPVGEDIFLSDGYDYSPDMKLLALPVIKTDSNYLYLYNIFENEKAVVIIESYDYIYNANFISDKIIYLYDRFDMMYEITLY